jgi:lysophospholipase L1-like esterase
VTTYPTPGATLEETAVQVLTSQQFAGLITGHVSLATSAQGVQPLRLPTGDAPYYDPFNRATASMTAGVRLRLTTNTRRLHLRLHQLQSYITHPGQWPTVYELRLNENAGRRVSASGGAQFSNGRVDGDPKAVLEINDLPAGSNQVELWLPNTALVTIESVAIDAGAQWAPWPDNRPRLLFHGSSITHGVGADASSESWPAVVGRLAEAQLLNLGWAGSCLISGLASRVVRDQPADFITLELGANVYEGGLLKERTFSSAVHSMLSIVREKHINTPIVVMSPIYAPAWESIAQGDGLTVQQMRILLQQAVVQRLAADRNLHYVSGLDLFGPSDATDLPDGLHPNAAGYTKIGERFHAAAKQILPG